MTLAVNCADDQLIPRSNGIWAVGAYFSCAGCIKASAWNRARFTREVERLNLVELLSDYHGHGGSPGEKDSSRMKYFGQVLFGL